MSDALQIAREFTEAWTRRDLRSAEAFIADDIVFDSPVSQMKGKTPYLEGLTKLSQIVTDMNWIDGFGDAEFALIMYDLSTGPYGTFTCAKRIVVSEGKIIKDKLVFDSQRMKRP